MPTDIGGECAPRRAISVFPSVMSRLLDEHFAPGTALARLIANVRRARRLRPRPSPHVTGCEYAYKQNMRRSSLSAEADKHLGELFATDPALAVARA